MRKEHGIVIVRTLPIVVGIIATLASGCGSNDAAQSATPTTTATTSTDATANKSLLTSYTGSNSATVSGTWTNNTFGTTGDVTATVSFNSTTNKITVVFDIDGSVYGGGDPAAETFTLDMTNFIANGTDTFAVTSATYGDVSGTITFKTDNTGTFSGTATNEPTGSVKNGAFSGTFSISGGKVTVTISDTTFTFMGTPVTCSNNLTTKLN